MVSIINIVVTSKFCKIREFDNNIINSFVFLIWHVARWYIHDEFWGFHCDSACGNASLYIAYPVDTTFCSSHYQIILIMNWASSGYKAQLHTGKNITKIVGLFRPILPTHKINVPRRPTYTDHKSRPFRSTFTII